MPDPKRVLSVFAIMAGISLCATNSAKACQPGYYEDGMLHWCFPTIQTVVPTHGGLRCAPWAAHPFYVRPSA
jgi:hypothetical protein